MMTTMNMMMTHQSIKRPMIAFVGLPMGGEESESHLLSLGFKLDVRKASSVQATMRPYGTASIKAMVHCDMFHAVLVKKCLNCIDVVREKVG